MTKEIRKELNKARRLYKAGKKEEAFEIYDMHFQEDPEEFGHSEFMPNITIQSELRKGIQGLLGCFNAFFKFTAFKQCL